MLPQELKPRRSSNLKYCAIACAFLLLLLLYRTQSSSSSKSVVEESTDFVASPLSVLLAQNELSYVEGNFESLEQFDERLIRYVRARYLSPPPDPSTPYNFKYGPPTHKTEFSGWIRKLFKDKRGGTFIEAGANEGEFHSHTLELELELGWRGLLIECNPTVVPYLRTKRRKAWVAGVCISTTDHPSILNFSNPTNWSYSGRIGPAWDLPVKSDWTYFDVETVPLYSIIAAAGYHHIDYFSFDVEGIEFEILKNFPFDKITFNVIIAEVQFISQEKRDELVEFMQQQGYDLHKADGLDHIYFRQGFSP